MKVCSLCRRCYDDSVALCTEGHPPLSESRSGSCELVPGYRLEQQLGSGLKGETYRAREKVSGRTCLIKLFPPNTANREQFLYEARLAATIFHPNVADVYEADELESGELYVVAEDPEGRTARELLQETSTPPLLTAIQIVRHSAEAVHALHLKGLIHRAINPDNIVVSADPAGELLVRIQDPDFGGIAERSIVSNKFLIDTAVGSLRYFAPEQCSGEPESIKTDIYALGIVLYEMIAGVTPFDAPKATALIQMHRSLPPPEIRIDNFDLRMLLTHTLMESLQKQPRTRQSSANAFARQLRHMEQLATHVSTPPPAGVVPTPPPRQASFNAASFAAARTATVSPAEAARAAHPGYAEAVSSIVARTGSEPDAERPQALRPDLADVDPVAPVPAIFTAPVPVTVESESPIIDREFESESSMAMHIEGPMDDIPEMPDQIADTEPVNEVAEISAAAPPEPEAGEAEPRPVEIHALPVIEALTDEVAQSEVSNEEPVQTEVELPETIFTPAEPPIAAPVFARSEPTKVVWNDLDDDIPSEEDAQAALAEEQLPEPVAEPLTAEPVRVEVKAPTVPIVHVEPQKIETPLFSSAPAKVVWEGLEDDIPSEADVQAVLLEERSEPPITESIEPEPVRAEAKSPEIRVPRPEPQKVETIPTRPAPANVLWDDLDDIPSEADLEAVLLGEQLAEPFVVPEAEPSAPRAFLFEEKVPQPVEPEVKKASTPVRNAERKKPVYQPADDPIFAAYGGRSWPVVNINYRSVLIGVGFLTMAVVFFVGRVVMSDSFAGRGPVAPVEAQSVHGQQQPLPQPAQPNAFTPNKQPGLASSEPAPAADDELDASRLKPLTPEEGPRPQRQMFFPTPTARSVGRDETAKAAVVNPTVQAPPPAAVSQNVAKPLPFSPSVVIPYKGKAREKVVNEKDCADQQAPAAQNRSSSTKVADITRPRIVRDPKP